MKKKVLSFLMLLLAFMSWACTKELQSEKMNDEELIEILIPFSFMEVAGLNTKSTMEMFEGYGEEYCTSTKSDVKGVILKVTEEQQQNLIQMNNNYVDEVMEPFLSQNPLYGFSGSEDYSEVTFSYDEEADPTAIMLAIMRYMMNSLLLNTYGEWEIHITIVNCHSGNIVDEGVLPGAGLVFGPDEWEASYAE